MNEGKNLGGRPTIYSEELADRICELVANTPRSINSLYDEFDWFPASSTLYRWETEKPKFKEKYLCAKKEQVNSHVQETLKIADNAKHEIMAADPKIAGALAQVFKLQSDNRHWYASKIAPRIYGEKLIEEEEKKPDSQLTEAERIERVKEILGAAKDRV